MVDKSVNAKSSISESWAAKSSAYDSWVAHNITIVVKRKYIDPC